MPRVTKAQLQDEIDKLNDNLRLAREHASEREQRIWDLGQELQAAELGAASAAARASRYEEMMESAGAEHVREEKMAAARYRRLQDENERLGRILDELALVAQQMQMQGSPVDVTLRRFNQLLTDAGHEPWR